VTTFLLLWAGTSALVLRFLLRAAREDTPTPTELPHAHDPADCDVCCWASDVGVIAAIDWALWSSEMEAAS
jgi:hypothetical protein